MVHKIKKDTPLDSIVKFIYELLASEQSAELLLSNGESLRLPSKSTWKLTPGDCISFYDDGERFAIVNLHEIIGVRK